MRQDDKRVTSWEQLRTFGMLFHPDQFAMLIVTERVTKLDPATFCFARGHAAEYDTIGSVIRVRWNMFGTHEPRRLHEDTAASIRNM